MVPKKGFILWDNEMSVKIKNVILSPYSGLGHLIQDWGNNGSDCVFVELPTSAIFLSLNNRDT